ncbi:MAG: hypothetical protein K6C12_01725 [Oscillospiraceae bacterium]|nr:hypothetical protein [Oscillospiraceae bacterium]
MYSGHHYALFEDFHTEQLSDEGVLQSFIHWLFGMRPKERRDPAMEKYTALEMEIITFDVEDVITTSPTDEAE